MRQFKQGLTRLRDAALLELRDLYRCGQGREVWHDCGTHYEVIDQGPVGNGFTARQVAIDDEIKARGI